MLRAVLGSLQFPNKSIEPWRQYDQVTRVRGLIRVGHTSWYENGSASRDVELAVGKPKVKGPFKDMPRFVVGVMHMERGGPTASPLINHERLPPSREWAWLGSARYERNCDHRFRHGREFWVQVRGGLTDRA